MKIVLAVTLASVFAFMWGFLSWEVLPWHQPQAVQSPESFQKVLSEQANTHAVYAVPSWEASKKDGMKSFRAGPYFYGVIRPGISEGSMGKSMLIGFGTQVLSVCLFYGITLLGTFKKFSKYLLLGLLVGLITGVSASIPAWNWLEYPARDSIAHFSDSLIIWTGVGIIFGTVCRKRKKRYFAVN